MTRRPRDPTAFEWLAANGHDTAGLTGQETHALLAIASAWELYACGDDNGQHAAIGAVAHLCNGLQRKHWPLAKELIAKALDWPDRERLWPLVIEGGLYAADEG